MIWFAGGNVLLHLLLVSSLFLRRKFIIYLLIILSEKQRDKWHTEEVCCKQMAHSRDTCLGPAPAAEAGKKLSMSCTWWVESTCSSQGARGKQTPHVECGHLNLPSSLLGQHRSLRFSF